MRRLSSAIFGAIIAVSLAFCALAAADPWRWGLLDLTAADRLLAQLHADMPLPPSILLLLGSLAGVARLSRSGG